MERLLDDRLLDDLLLRLLEPDELKLRLPLWLPARPLPGAACNTHNVSWGQVLSRAWSNLHQMLGSSSDVRASLSALQSSAAAVEQRYGTWVVSVSTLLRDWDEGWCSGEL